MPRNGGMPALFPTVFSIQHVELVEKGSCDKYCYRMFVSVIALNIMLVEVFYYINNLPGI